MLEGVVIVRDLYNEVRVELSQECNRDQAMEGCREQGQGLSVRSGQEGPAVWSGESERGGCYKEGQGADEAI